MTMSPCPICGKGELSKKYLETCDLVTREKFTLIECDFCGVKKTHPVPLDISRYYDTDVGLIMRKNPGMVHLILKSILLRMELSRITKRLKIKNFLDVGCGNGDFSKMLYEAGYKVTAIDSAVEKPIHLRTINLPYCIINYDDYTIKDFQPVQGSLMILRHLLEHIKEPLDFMVRMRSYGAEAFYIVVPDISSLKSKFLGQYNSFLDPPRHIWHFNEKVLKIFFEKLNLEIVACGHDTIPAFVPSLYRFLRITNMPEWLYRIFEPKGSVAALSLPLDWLLPNDIIWFLVKKA